MVSSNFSELIFILLYVAFIAWIIILCIKEANKIINSEISEKEQDKPKKKFSAMIWINFIITFVMCLTYDGIASGVFLFFIIGITFIWLPLMLTGFNIRNLIKNNHTAINTDVATIFIGGVYYIMLEGITLDETGKDYTEAIYPDQYHAMLNNEYGAIIEWVMVIGFISMILLCVRKPMKTPPLQSALCIAFTSIMLLLMGTIQIQMICNFESAFIMFYLYYINLIIISARRIHYHITEQVRLADERETVFRTKAGEKLHKIMSTISGMTKFSFMLILPIVIICEILYIVFGQGADGFIKAFTMTADWTFSTQIPPPPLEYEGHYLCTVASGGHKKVVKPIRYGIRRNQKIVVNRQLLIANAFEDLMHEHFPKAHKKIRNFYDAYGYPVSRHITTRTRADIVYIIMKPLEYLFIAILYMFDVQPENRIAVQYSEYKTR
ncbi:MAG: hypothetical protein NC040_08530 [Muribaculaceae bacterium]|nr:hypothetical protein [Alistipes senegalensis]MCM1474091.1 hypothetical protein [Muribaculaceae bacterium]